MKVGSMNVSTSNTRIKEAETLTVNLLWNNTKSETDHQSVQAELINEKLTDKQLKIQWNHIDWKTVETHVNRIQVRITKAVIKGK